MIVLTAGTFDTPHYGHLRFLRKCQELGSVTIGLNTDSFVEKYKGKTPIFTYEERETTLKEWGFSLILPNDQPDGTMQQLIQYVQPQLIVVGSDWLRKDYLKQIGVTPGFLDENNVWLTYVKYEWNISSTEIKRRINEKH